MSAYRYPHVTNAIEQHIYVHLLPRLFPQITISSTALWKPRQQKGPQTDPPHRSTQH